MLLQGVPYPQPYVIEAVGDHGDLLTAVAADDYLQAYREQADDPEIAVGWDLDARGRGHRAGVRRPARPDLRDAAQPAATDRLTSRRRRRPVGGVGRVGSVGTSVGGSVGVGRSASAAS